MNSSKIKFAAKALSCVGVAMALMVSAAGLASASTTTHTAIAITTSPAQGTRPSSTRASVRVVS